MDTSAAWLVRWRAFSARRFSETSLKSEQTVPHGRAPPVRTFPRSGPPRPAGAAPAGSQRRYGSARNGRGSGRVRRPLEKFFSEEKQTSMGGLHRQGVRAKKLGGGWYGDRMTDDLAVLALDVGTSSCRAS